MGTEGGRIEGHASRRMAGPPGATEGSRAEGLASRGAAGTSGEGVVRIQVLADAEAVARAAASLTAAEARAAVDARGRFVVALSGGRTPWTMLRALANEDVPWAGVHVFQVDERVAPDGDPDRNLTHIRESLLAHCPIPPDQVHAMPVESADLAA